MLTCDDNSGKTGIFAVFTGDKALINTSIAEADVVDDEHIVVNFYGNPVRRGNMSCFHY